MKVLLLNAGSRTLEGTFLEAADHAVIARSLADWAGPVTHYQHTRPQRQGALRGSLLERA
jgi:hypothetical protein